MPVIFRWIFAGCISRSLITMAGLLAIYAIIEAFDKARYIGHGMTGALVVEYLLLKAPFMISEFMPFIVLIAATVFLAELSRHHETVALGAAGLGVNKLLAPLLTAALLASIFSFGIGEWVAPVTNQRLDTIERVNIRHKKPSVQGIQWLKDERHFFRLAPLGKDQFAMMMLETDASGTWVRRIDARRAQFNDGHWRLTDVHISTPSKDKGMSLKHLPSMSIDSKSGPETAELPRPRHMNAVELYRYIKDLSHAGLSASSYSYTLHHKFSAPLACLIMVIMATALYPHAGNRGGASRGLMLTIALGLVFYLFGNATFLLANSDQLSAAYAAWFPSLVFGGLSVFLLLKREGH